MDLKEQTISVDSIADKKIEYQGGSFIVREIESGKLKYSIPKTKKDGGTTVAYEKSLKVEVGDTITVAVDEQQKSFMKDGVEKTYTKRTIRDIKGDEHGVPHTSQSANPVPTNEVEVRLTAIEKRLEALEGVETSEINPEDLPF